MILLLASMLAIGQPAKPNVVFIVADDLGSFDVSWRGGKIPTPNLDKLALAGARLEAHYVLPVCSPTRAALMTGRYPMRHGLQEGVVRPWARYGLPLDERTLPQALRDAGYETAITGKWHLGHFERDYLPTRRGFDHQYGHYMGAIDYFKHDRDGGFDWHRDDTVCREEGYSTDLIASEAARLVEKRDTRKPLFLYVPFNAVHAPLQVAERHQGLFPDLKPNRRKYACMLTAMDEGVGKIVAEVEKAGIRDNTLFVFTSDNGGPNPGPLTDNGPYRAGKGTLYEGGVRVAAFATWPGKIKPGEIDQPLHVVDWYPTLVKLAGGKLTQAKPLDGVDLWPVLTGKAGAVQREILINTTENGGAIRVGDHKLVVAGKKVELFNLKQDPGEKTNLAESESSRVRELSDRLEKFRREAVPSKQKPQPDGYKAPAVWGE
ncbi:MAG: arylsulfatase B [Gemmataceae bacterium]